MATAHGDASHRHQCTLRVYRDERGEKVDGARRKAPPPPQEPLRYHDPKNWLLLRDALKAMGRADLIGNGKHHLIPTYQPMAGSCGGQKNEKFLTIPSMVMEKKQPKPGQTLTQHTRPAATAGTRYKAELPPGG